MITKGEPTEIDEIERLEIGSEMTGIPRVFF